MSFVGPKIWKPLSSNIKDSENLTISNQILNLGSLKTAHAVCAGYTL